jgi:TIR domain
MADVFISYSHKDFKIAQTLVDRLEVLGVEPWWDTSLSGADNFTEEIHKQLVDAKAVIVIWSPHSTTSTYVRKEASIALQSKKLIATRTVNLHYAALPDGFREQHTDLVEDLKQIEAEDR